MEFEVLPIKGWTEIDSETALSLFSVQGIGVKLSAIILV